MPAELWRFNPQTALFQRDTADGVTHTATYQELSGEEYILTPGLQLAPIAGGPIYQQGGAGEVSYVRYGNGYGELTSQLAGRPARLYGAETATYGVAGDLHITLPTGEVLTQHVDMADLYGFGQRLYQWVDEFGDQQFGAFVPGSTQQLSAEQAAGPTWREATTDEAIVNAVRGYLANNARDLLELVAGKAGEGNTEEAREARYDTALSLAQLAVGQLNLAKSHLVGFSRER